MNHAGVARMRPCRALRKKGNITLLAAMLMLFLVSLVAVVIDASYTAHIKSQLGRAVDAGALAGAGALTDGEDAATTAAVEFVQRNPIGQTTIPRGNVDVLLGEWQADTHTFYENPDKHTAIQVLGIHESERRFFARLLGERTMTTAAAAIAVYQPRDIMLVLDYSAVMNDDTEFAGIARLGRATVEANLRQVYFDLGSPQHGNLSLNPVMLVGTPLTILTQLGLAGEPYPYPAGSWLEYIVYVLTDPTVNSAGYRGQFSYITLMNYWQAMRPSANETPGLWMTSQQPLTAVKTGVEDYIDQLNASAMNDQVGLVIFAAEGGSARLEAGLSLNFQEVTQVTRERQAAHHEKDPKMASGIRVALKELANYGRPDAEQLIVLVTDGNAARKGKEPQNASVAQADRAAAAGVSIVTISLGQQADQTLMQNIADISGGKHIHILMDSTPEEYTEEIKEAFRSFAAARKARLVN